jgi:hypothetical protein
MSLSEGVGLEIVKASYDGDYRIDMEFSDGHRSEMDFKSFLSSNPNSETRQFLDTNRFKDFRIEWGNLVWGDYDMCFPLEDLYSAELIKSPLLAVAEKRATYGSAADSTET